MFNHFHIQLSAQCRKDIEDFMRAVSWTYATLYNRRFGLKGQLFKHTFGSSPKTTPHKISGNWIYIANNPLGKKAVQKAWDYRWNFLRYAPANASSKHPFSEEYDPLSASGEMSYLVKKIRSKAKAGEYIDYRFFDSEKYTSLSVKERRQIIDIIISCYNVIDYGPLLRKFGTMERFCHVLEEVEGNEYDVGDDWEPEDYKHYVQMISISAQEGYDLQSKRYSASTMPPQMAEKLIFRFKTEAGATDLEIGKFLKDYGKNKYGSNQNGEYAGTL